MPKVIKYYQWNKEFEHLLINFSFSKNFNFLFNFIIIIFFFLNFKKILNPYIIYF